MYLHLSYNFHSISMQFYFHLPLNILAMEIFMLVGQMFQKKFMCDQFYCQEMPNLKYIGCLICQIQSISLDLLLIFFCEMNLNQYSKMDMNFLLILYIVYQLRAIKDVSGDRPNLQTIDEQNLTTTGDCGDSVGKNADVNVTEFIYIIMIQINAIECSG